MIRHLKNKCSAIWPSKSMFLGVLNDIKSLSLRLTVPVAIGLTGIVSVAAAGWEVETAPIIALSRYAGNTGAFWGYHQPIIVRAGSRIYAGLLEPWGEDHKQQWGLFEKEGESWTRVYASPKSKLLNQPPILLVDALGRLHAFVWLDGICNHLRFDPDGHIEAPIEEIADVGYNDLWPYAGGASNAEGDVLVVPSSYPAHRYGFLSADADTWRQGTAAEFAPRPDSPSNFNRHAYPFVALRGREAHIFSSQDINDAEKIAAGENFTYSFRTLEYYYSPDLLASPFEMVTVVDVEASKGWAHNDDLLIDKDGQVHVLYRYQNRENEGPISPLMHAFGPPGGPFTHVAVSSEDNVNEGRLWEAPNGVLFAIRAEGNGLVAEQLDKDGRRLGDPAVLGIYPLTDDYTSSRVFLVPARASAAGAPFLEGLYQTQGTTGQTTVQYFHAMLPELLADVDGDGIVNFGDFLLFVKSFGKKRGELDFNIAADGTADGVVNFLDFVLFARGFGLALE
jgi:hypothetical protein